MGGETNRTCGKKEGELIERSLEVTQAQAIMTPQRVISQPLVFQKPIHSCINLPLRPTISSVLCKCLFFPFSFKYVAA